ncbi:MAG: PQQ-dependent sugar dehydrogenase, partial [Halohasta sp.]
MNRRRYLSVAGLAACGMAAGCLDAGSADSESDLPSGVAAETVVEDLDAPWGLAFLDGTWLAITERDEGRLLLVDREEGTTRDIDGVPAVDSAGQGGLLDVTTHPEFPDEPWLYLTYSAANDAGETTTHLGRGRLDIEAASLSAFEVLHRAEPFL